MKAIEYVDRASGERREEIIYGERFVRWAYQDGRERWYHRLLFRSALPSRLLGFYFDTCLSRPRVRPAIAQLGLDVDEFRDPVDSFGSFNAFFTRHLKPEARPADPDPAALLAPGDGRTLVYHPLEADRAIPVKGRPFSVNQLLQRPAPDYAGGTIYVVRLCPADYHRFHFPADGEVIDQWEISGAYHSVNPIALALGINVFEENRRACTLLRTERFGTIACIEVGAFGVGTIVQTYDDRQVARFEEKGYFKFGGSTLILALQRGMIAPSPDLLTHSAAGTETLVQVGQAIGRAVTGTD